MIATVIGVAGAVATAAPVAADDEVVVEIIDATGPSSGVAPSTTEPVLTTQVPLPPDTSLEPEPVLSTQVPLPPDTQVVEPEAPELVINGPATVGEPTDTSVTTTTTVPALVIEGPATVTPSANEPATPVVPADPAPVVLGASGTSDDHGVAAAAPRNAAPSSPVLPSTGLSEAAWSAAIATVLLLVGTALFGVRRRDDGIVG